MKLGIEKQDAQRITVYGCYETSAEGTEIPCTCASYICLPKAIELSLNNGHDMQSGDLLGCESDAQISTFEDYLTEVKRQLKALTESIKRVLCELEGYYPQICPSLVMSPTYKHSAESGIELYSGGAKYNNTSIIGAGISTLVDAVAAVKKIVFDEHKISFEDLKEVMKKDWQGEQSLQHYCRQNCPKFGNNDEEADALAAELTSYFADLINGHPNGRNGVFRCGMFSVDMRFWLSEKLSATPDGRNKGEAISKNAAATIGKDKNGVTAYLSSLLKLDHSKIPDGCVADVVLHESAVNGADGLTAFKTLLKVFMDNGGHSVHFNVLNADKLIKAQKDPEKYKNLQVRLCGWNVRFNDLSKRDQDEFIIKAKMGC
jgi:formate C-acetyltransferase